MYIMEFPEPQPNEFTIYSKSGCPNCVKTKQLLNNHHLNYKVIDCHEFLLENKEEFLLFIKKLAEKEYRTFPMVFDDKKFVGGFDDTKTYIDDILAFNSAF